MKKVVKFGGSSLADAKQFRKVAKIIHDDPTRVYVVPSAPGKRFKGDTKVTDLLYKAYGAENEEVFENTFALIKERYQSIIDDLELNISLEDEFSVIYENFKHQIGEDYAASRGEYLNGILLAEYLHFNFIDAADVIFIDENGNYDQRLTDKALSAKLAVNPHAVVPGFYGSLNDGSGKIKTFSRGGSDVTGSIVARNGECNLYENWTDVSGFLIADPSIISNPQPIERITYKELRELSYMGASVLHENSIFPIRSLGIPIIIKNTNRPQDPGTEIVETTCHKPEHYITGIAGKKGFATISIEKDLMNSEVGFGRKVLQVIENEGLNFEHMPSGIDTLNVILEEKEFIQHEQQILSGIHRAVSPDSITLEADLALVAVVGRGLKNGRGVAARVFKALADKNINIKMIDQGSSELNIIVGVRNRYFEDAIKAIYNEFIGQE